MLPISDVNTSSAAINDLMSIFCFFLIVPTHFAFQIPRLLYSLVCEIIVDFNLFLCD